jgi:cell division septation protein DedD
MEKQSMKHEWKWRHVFFLSLILAAAACRSIVPVSRPPEPRLPKRELRRMGYTIQVGAFLIVDNAIKLTKSLNKKGLNAYYFAHPSGLYKVRFGDFRSLRNIRSLKGESMESSISGMKSWQQRKDFLACPIHGVSLHRIRDLTAAA